MSVALAQTATAQLPNREFALEQGALTQQDWDRLVRSGETRYGLSTADAEGALDLAIAMLRLLAKDEDGNYMPSDFADLGRHILMPYTRIDHRLCEVIVGRFVHHDPHDEIGVSYEHGVSGAARTFAAMQSLSLPVEAERWNRKVDADFRDYDCTSSGTRPPTFDEER